MRKLAYGMVIATVSALAGGMSFYYASGSEGVIEASYAFDVTDRGYVAGYADTIVVATVDQVVETQADRQTTLYRVSIEEALEGDPGRSAVVRQLGYDDGRDRFVPEDQPMLAEGGSYLLALTRADGGQYTVIGGPVAATELTGGSRARIEDTWRAAVADQRYPPGVPR
ncbi:MAG TPA: hypothetical protein VFD59_20050 [Nocardioidaceae bacterium]|nr:hypothetical protein [Nocardioidaceae bacterium]